MTVSPAHAPRLAGAPHLTDPSGTLVGYWTDPPGAVVSFIRSARGTSELAQWLIGDAAAQLLARFPHADDLTVVLDMRMMAGRSAMARSALLQAGEALAGRIAHVVLLPSTRMGPAYISVIEAAALVLRLWGYRVDIEHDLDAALARHRIHPQTFSDVHALAPTRSDEPRK